MNNDDMHERLGRLTEGMDHVRERVDSISGRLDEHMSSEEARLRNIEHQLSLGRFLLLVAKGILLTIGALLAFKFGDISALWKGLLR